MTTINLILTITACVAWVLLALAVVFVIWAVAGLIMEKRK